MNLTVIKRPQVKKMLRIPELPPTPPGQQPSFDLFSALKKLKGMTQDPTQNQTQPLSTVNPRISSTSLSPVSKRLKALESQVKGRKKNSSKKRWFNIVHSIFVRGPKEKRIIKAFVSKSVEDENQWSYYTDFSSLMKLSREPNIAISEIICFFIIFMKRYYCIMPIEDCFIETFIIWSTNRSNGILIFLVSFWFNIQKQYIPCA